MRFSRDRSCSVEMPGSTRWSSTNRRGPAARSRMINSVHLSPTRSRARASGDHWSYGWRLGGGTGGIGGSLTRCLEVRAEYSVQRSEVGDIDISADHTDVSESASSNEFARFMCATGARALASGMTRDEDGRNG